jgi:hypothetical protein
VTLVQQVLVEALEALRMPQVETRISEAILVAAWVAVA